MDRLKFYFKKMIWMGRFVWWGDWWLVREEWNVTYQQMVETRDRWPEIEQQAIERLLKAIEAEERKE